MSLHPTTFAYLQPTPEQINTMGATREGFANFARFLDDMLPEGPDKTYVLRHLRECAMWANIAITRLPDGTPRS